MIRTYNHVSQSSEIRGWGVTTTDTSNSKKKHHNICLTGVEKGIRLGIDRHKYENLTVVDAGMVFPNPNCFTKLYSLYLGGDKYLPIITETEEKDNKNILLFNFETEANEIITSIEFINLNVISYYVTSKGEDMKSRISLAAITVDPDKDYGIEVKYGFAGGQSLQIHRITYKSLDSIKQESKNQQMSASGLTKSISVFDIDTSHERVEKIEPVRLNIHRMDLSAVCINPQ